MADQGVVDFLKNGILCSVMFKYFTTLKQNVK